MNIKSVCRLTTIGAGDNGTIQNYSTLTYDKLHNDNEILFGCSVKDSAHTLQKLQNNEYFVGYQPKTCKLQKNDKRVKELGFITGIFQKKSSPIPYPHTNPNMNAFQIREVTRIDRYIPFKIYLSTKELDFNLKYSKRHWFSSNMKGGVSVRRPIGIIDKLECCRDIEENIKINKCIAIQRFVRYFINRINKNDIIYLEPTSKETLL